MPATILGSLLVSLGLESGEFKSGLSQAEKDLRRSTKRIEAVGDNMASLGGKLSLAVTAPLTALGIASVRAAMESKAAIGQVEAALVSMGKAAGFTSDQLKGMAEGLMKTSLFDDDEILQKVTANLLTFGNVAGDVFARAQQAAVDLSVRLGQDLQSSAIQVGKALNDPVNGVTALQRVGVKFTDQQKALIKSLVDTGRAADAQRLILVELEKQFVGSAQAARDADPMGATKQSWAEFQEKIGAQLLIMLPAITDALTSVLEAFNSLSPGMQKAAVIGGIFVAAIGPIVTAMGAIISISAPLIAAFKLVAAAAISTGSVTGALTVSWAALKAAALAAASAVGVLGAALAAVVAVFAVAYLGTLRMSKASEEYRKRETEANEARERAAGLAQTLATATGKAREEALKAAQAERTLAAALLATARASLIAAKARADAAAIDARSSSLNAVTAGPLRAIGVTFGIGPLVQNAKAKADLASAQKTAAEAKATLETLDRALAAPSPASLASNLGGGGAGSGGKGNKGSGGGGPSASDIQQRFNDELVGLAQQALSAQQSQTRSAEEKAELDLRNVELARIRTEAGIKADKDYTQAQKNQLLAQLETTVEEERRAIEFEKRRQLEQEAQSLADETYRAQSDALQIQYDLADSQTERKRIALEQLDLEHRHMRALLEGVIASETVADAEKERARLLLQSLNETAAAQRQRVSQGNATPAERFMRDLNKTPQAMNEAFDQIKIDGLNAFNDGLTDAIVNFKSLGDVARGVLRQVLADLLRLQIQQAIIKPLAGALGLGGGGGGGGFLGSLLKIGGAVAGASSGGGLKDISNFKAIKGFAGGTRFAPGGLSLVGEEGPELVNLRRGSQVIPNNELNGIGSRTEVHRPTFVFPGITDPKGAREAAGQAARRYRRELTPMRSM